MLLPARAAISSPDALLTDLLAVSLTGVIIYRPQYDATGEIEDFTFEYLNPAAQRMMGMPEQPTLTHNQQWPHSKVHGTFAFHVEAFLSGEPRRYDVNYQADGYDNYYCLAARRSGDGLLVSFTDTADQPRTPVEVALRESQAREQQARAEAEAQREVLHGVFTQAPVAIALLDGPDYRITLANPPVCEIWARLPAQLLGLPLLEALPELQGQGIDALLDGVLHSGEPHVGTELPVELVRHGRRETIYFNFVYQPQRTAQGEVTGVLVVASDVTEIVTARHRVEAQERETAVLNEELAAANEELAAANEEYLTANEALSYAQQQLTQLNQALEDRVQSRTREAQVLNQELAAINEELLASNEELATTNAQLVRTNVDLDNFIYAASHDLQAPISNIEGLLQALQADLLPVHPRGDAATLLGLMGESVERFQRTIAHLTDVSKLQKEHSQPSTRVSLPSILEDVRLDLAPLVQQVGAELRVEVRATPTVHFSEKNLRSVLYNLLSNALKYHHPERPPVVQVRSRRQNAQVVVEVQDNGLGIEAAHQPKLFTMFQRFHTHVEGTGIGLYMVKKMVENAGGRLEVHSQVGVGTTFSVYLPHPTG